MRVSAWRTPRCTVTAASYWLSLLSRLTRLRLRTTVRVPPPAPEAPPPPPVALPCGPAQAVSAEPMAVVTPMRPANCRMERREIPAPAPVVSMDRMMLDMNFLLEVLCRVTHQGRHCSCPKR